MWATSFNQDLSSWKVPLVTDFSEMFHLAKSFNQNLCSWSASITANDPLFTETFKNSGCPVIQEDPVFEEEIKGYSPMCVDCFDTGGQEEEGDELILVRDGVMMKYVLNGQSQSQCDHQKIAENCGGNLASIISQQEFDLLIEYSNACDTVSTPVWLGGYQSRVGPLKCPDSLSWTDEVVKTIFPNFLCSELVRGPATKNETECKAETPMGPTVSYLSFVNEKLHTSPGCDAGDCAVEIPAIYILPVNYKETVVGAASECPVRRLRDMQNC